MKRYLYITIGLIFMIQAARAQITINLALAIVRNHGLASGQTRLMAS